jgi:GNAT superfamily N-acetyltransferase
MQNGYPPSASTFIEYLQQEKHLNIRAQLPSMKEREAIVIRQQARLDQAMIAGIHRMWNRVYPAHLVHTTIQETETYIENRAAARHMVALKNDALAAWCCVFEREERQWFVLLVDDPYQRMGLGRHLMKLALDEGTPLNGWVIDHDRDLRADGKPYASPMNFYLKLGFHVCEERLRLGQLSAVRICATPSH